MNHKAIYALYAKVKYINDELGCFDATGNKVEVDMDAINSWVDPEQYKYDRAMKYLPIQEQLDMQYWDKKNGTTNWEDHITKVKTDIPKE
jgi:hypothetical protein